MTIEVNSNFPDQTLRMVVASELQEVDSSEYLADKKVMLVGVPGAFTPTCTSQQLPGFENNIAEFKKHFIDEIYCVSVNFIYAVCFKNICLFFESW